MTEQRRINAGATFQIPAGTYCQYAVSVNTAALQWVEVFDPKGGLVFSAAGSSGGPRQQIAGGGFLTPGDDGASQVYRIIFGCAGGAVARRLASVKTMISKLSDDAGQPIYRCLSFVASDSGDFSTGVDALAQIFYLPKAPPPPPRSHGVIAVVDAEAILARGGNLSLDPLNPTPVPDESVILLESGDDDPLSDNSTGTLLITAGVGEKLALVATTPSGDAGLAAIIYDVATTGGVLEPATAVLAQTEQPVPVIIDGQVDPTRYAMAEEPLFVWLSHASAAGDAQVTLSFYLTKIDGGEIKAQGYFVWSGKLTVIGR